MLLHDIVSTRSRSRHHRSIRVSIVAVFFLAAAARLHAAGPNPVTNGGFERLDPTGWPVDWERVGREAVLVHDAYEGRNAVLLRRTPEIAATKSETGLNRVWSPHSGQRGTMLEQRKGGIRFRYKVLRADPDMQLRFYVIPMSADPFENAGSPRAYAEADLEAAGDGHWHEGVVAYDFTDNDKCRWVQVSPRIVGTGTAEWILDDIRWVESTGPIPQISSFTIYESPSGAEGFQLRAVVRNTGDRPLQGRAQLRLPAGLAASEGLERGLPTIAPGMAEALDWTVRGARKAGQRIVLLVRGDGNSPATRRTLVLRAKIGGVWLEAQHAVMWPGLTANVNVVIRNTGSAELDRVRLKLETGPGLAIEGDSALTVERILPGALRRAAFRVKAEKQVPGTFLRCRWQTAAGESGECRSVVVVAAPPPNPNRLTRSDVEVRAASWRIIFPRNEFGYGVGWLFTANGKQAGVIPSLGRIVPADNEAAPVLLYADRPERLLHGAALGASSGAPVRGAAFPLRSKLLQRVGFRGSLVAEFAVAGNKVTGAAADVITCRIRGAATPGTRIRLLEAPLLVTGDGAGIAERSEALFPGLEWLAPGEYSSWDTDIAPDHPHCIRARPHPHMVTIPVMAVRRGNVCTSLMWHPRSRWCDLDPAPSRAPDASDNDRPTPIFASPDRFGGRAGDVMGLAIPNTPAFMPPNSDVGETPWPPASSRTVRINLVFGLWASPKSNTALDAVDAWTAVYSWPNPRPLPHVRGEREMEAERSTRWRGPGLPEWARTAGAPWPGLPRKTWIGEIDWSAEAYLKTLWVPDKHGWLNFVGGPSITRRVGPHSPYLFDCVLGQRLTDSEALRKRLNAIIADVQAHKPSAVPQADDLGFLFGNPEMRIEELAGSVVALVDSQDAQGGWRFHARIGKSGVFRGRDYRKLGYEGQEAIGLCARKAWSMLRIARITGDRRLREAGLKALRYMDKFRIPRAAQVWEVPVHTPDILASSDACEAYLEAWRITGDRRWLDRAVYWERTGLPFLYTWDVDAFPYLRYASIPVFGATWMRGSWFGRPVQWNGLRWAFAALKLAEADQSQPWRMLAAGVTISAMYQQGTDPEAEDYALWPDSISAIDAHKARWYFAPAAILKNVYTLLGYTIEPVTAVVSTPDRREIRVTACADISEGRFANGNLSFVVNTPPPLSSAILVCGVTPPTAVRVDGAALPRAESLSADRAGYRAYVGRNMVVIRTGRTGACRVVLEGVRARPSRVVPEKIKHIRFEFSTDDGGWRAAHDIGETEVRDGCLVVQVTGGDPYLVRPFCAIDGDRVSRIHVRMAVDAGEMAQFYWATEQAPLMSEARTVRVSVTPDGRFHDLVFDVSEHPQWRGCKIISIRLDPTNGAAAATARIDFIRGE